METKKIKKKNEFQNSSMPYLYNNMVVPTRLRCNTADDKTVCYRVGVLYN